MDNILEVKNIKKTFPGVTALNNVSFSVERGEVHALMGENGAGKSTLMKILSGVHPPTKGEIILNGKNVNIHNPNESLRLGISMIFQELSPIPELTIAENIFTGIRFPRKIKGFVDWKKAYAQCEELFRQWDLDYKPKMKMRSLSIADTQMIEIVKAISFDSKLIIMDEPTSALTDKEVRKLFSFIRTLKEKGITIIIITHKIDEVFQITDTVSVLRDGQYIGTRPTSEITKDEMITMMVGRDVKNIFVKKDCEIGEPVLEVRNLNREKLVKNIDFVVRKGEILGFAGIMGAGRTETMKCIFGLDSKTSGEIKINGKPLNIKSPRDAIKNGIMMITEDRKHDGLVLCRSIYENMLLPSTFRNTKFGIINKKKESSRVDEMYNRLSIKAPSIKTITNQLSGGNQQKVIIAKWLLMNPKVLIMDEPTRGIDVGAKAEIYKLMRKLAEQGVAIIIVTSDMEELLGISDKIAVMCKGQITGTVDRDNFKQEKIMQYATAIE